MLEYQEPEPRFISLIYRGICNLVEHEEIEINASKRKFQDSTKCQGQGESLPHTLSWVLIYFHEIASFPELSEQTYTFFLFVFVFILFYTKINSTVHSTPLHLPGSPLSHPSTTNLHPTSTYSSCEELWVSHVFNNPPSPQLPLIDSSHKHTLDGSCPYALSTTLSSPVPCFTCICFQLFLEGKL